MHVTVNCAMSLDGRLALAGGAPLALSGPEDFARVHALREASDAVLVGVGTVLADDPSLLVKAIHLGHEPRRQPARVVLDSTARAPATARVFDGRSPCHWVTAAPVADAPKSARVLTVPGADGRVDLTAALAGLAERGIERVMVEGGGTTIASFLAADLVDDFTVYVAPVLIGDGAPALFTAPGARGAADVTRLRLADTRPLGDGVVLTFHPRSGDA